MATTTAPTELRTDASLTVTPLTGSVGARIDGVDLRTLSETQFHAIHTALLQHCMLVFRDQTLSIDNHFAFGARWGEVSIRYRRTSLQNVVQSSHGLSTDLREKGILLMADTSYVNKQEGIYWVTDSRVSLDSIVYAFLEGHTAESI